MDREGLIERAVAHGERVGRVVAAFEREYGRRPEGIAEAPGRVNLIGEHVDYNDGLVLPFAIDRSVLCAWARRDDDAVWAYSVDYDDRSRFALADVAHAPRRSWAEYVRGVAAVLGRPNGDEDGAAVARRLSGVALAIAGDVPVGAGLSSSAAVEVAVAGAMLSAAGVEVDGVEVARLCQRAENEFVGVQSGIMDQFASALSRRGHALLIDCRTLAYEHVPLRLAERGLAVVIANSVVQRELVSSAYNERRRECEQAVALLRERLSRPELVSLRDVAAPELESVAIGDGEVVLRRARHVAGEIARVAAAAEALRRDDFEEVGRLMVESHLSLRDDYEVSSPELDLLVGLATAQEYVLGARLTGAGFGGCAVNLVRADGVDAFARDVIAPYRERTGLPAVMYVTEACDGLRVGW
ncbi:MAG TPA: galactokinase [Dehalococcoidia bacterium]|nr:galactokinase [Dehalococcoidia bacterium]